MFYPENVERQILHNSRSKVPYDNKPLIRSHASNPSIRESPIAVAKPNAERKIGGGPSGGGPSGGSGVSKLQSSSIATAKPAKLLSGGALGTSAMLREQKKPSAWQTLIKNTMKEKGLNMKEAIKFIKSNNLY